MTVISGGGRDRRTDRETDGQTDRQTDGQTDGQTDRQGDRVTENGRHRGRFLSWRKSSCHENKISETFFTSWNSLSLYSPARVHAFVCVCALNCAYARVYR